MKRKVTSKPTEIRKIPKDTWNSNTRYLPPSACSDHEVEIVARQR